MAKKRDINQPSKIGKMFGDKAGSPRVRYNNRKKKVQSQYDKEMTKVRTDFLDGNITSETAKKARKRIAEAAKVADSQAESEFKREREAVGKKKYGMRGGGSAAYGYNKGGVGKFRHGTNAKKPKQYRKGGIGKLRGM
jgi:hypothetical protein|tara:strand:- start:3388 stop:3801 length:414 start_codon:yes stop_codon:yes gene_type:complete